MEKEIITKKEIEQGIIHAIKHPAHTPGALYFAVILVMFAVMPGIVFLEHYIGKAAYCLTAVIFLAVFLQPAVKFYFRDRKSGKIVMAYNTKVFEYKS